MLCHGALLSHSPPVPISYSRRPCQSAEVRHEAKYAYLLWMEEILVRLDSYGICCRYLSTFFRPLCPHSYGPSAILTLFGLVCSQLIPNVLLPSRRPTAAQQGKKRERKAILTPTLGPYASAYQAHINNNNTQGKGYIHWERTR